MPFCPLGGRVYYIVGCWHRWFVKPAPTQAITQINLILEIIPKNVDSDLLSKRGRVYYIVGFRHR
jgi:hypothetical protein